MANPSGSYVRGGRRVTPLGATRSLNLENAGRELDRNTLTVTKGKTLDQSTVRHTRTAKPGDVKAYMEKTKAERAAAARLKREQSAHRQQSIVKQLERVESQRRKALKEGARATKQVRPPWNNTFATRKVEDRAIESRTYERSVPRNTRPRTVAAPTTRTQPSQRHEDTMASMDALGAMQRSYEDSIVDIAHGTPSEYFFSSTRPFYIPSCYLRSFFFFKYRCLVDNVLPRQHF